MKTLRTDRDKNASPFLLRLQKDFETRQHQVKIALNYQSQEKREYLTA